MERGLFLKAEKQKKLEDFGLSLAGLSVEDFQKAFSLKVNIEVCEVLEVLPESVKNNLYYLGSFGLGQPSLFSDLDLCFIGDWAKEKVKVESLLRANFRKYSLLALKSLDDLKAISNFKTLVSLRSIKPVFKADSNVNSLVQKDVISKKLPKIKEHVLEETLKRRGRFGEESGKLLFSFKTASGGMLDLKTLDLYEFKDFKKEIFVYKIRVLNQILYKKDQFYVTHAKKISELMSFEKETDFFNVLFENLRLVREKIDELLFDKKDWVDDAFSSMNLNVTPKEKALFLEKANPLWSRVNSPNYHIYTVGEHLKACLFEMIELINNEGEAHSITEDEKTILMWSALFHDLGKDQVHVPHSMQGSIYAREFGEACDWPANKTKDVAWLVRQHLTLATHAFKMDAFNPELLERLSLKGFSGRRAVLLFFLTVADTKATNPKSWSAFKKDILTAVLNKALGYEDEFKSELEEKVDPKKAFIVEGMGLKEISLIPKKFLSTDLAGDFEEGFKLYKLEDGSDGYWLRYYCEKDHLGLAYQLLSFLSSIGIYVDIALFSSKFERPVVYNWFKVESSLSPKALGKRLSVSKIFNSIETCSDLSKAKLFSSIQIRYRTNNYAVVSFKGGDRPGLLLAAVEVLAGASMSILWGHAITWGGSVEDLFGVTFSPESDWSFVEV